VTHVENVMYAFICIEYCSAHLFIDDCFISSVVVGYDIAVTDSALMLAATDGQIACRDVFDVTLANDCFQ